MLPPGVQHSIPDAILSRLIRQLSPFTELLPVAPPSAWEMVDHADPTAITGFNTTALKLPLESPTGPTRLHNTAPLDLASFSARVVEIIPTLTGMNAPSPSTSARSATPTSTPVGSITTINMGNERGLQSNFDSEVSSVGMSVFARDYRRTIVSDVIVIPGAGAGGNERTTRSTPTSTSGKNSRGEIIIDDSPVSTSRSTASNTNTTAAAAGGRGSKRKDPPEVLIIDSDEEEKEKKVQAPPVRAKRGRMASTTTVRGGKGKKRGG